jgi:hypothetical protein
MSSFDEEFNEPQRSLWAGFFSAIGVVLLAIGLILFADMALTNFGLTPMFALEKLDSSVVLILIGGGLQCLLFGFLINVFTDIRWYLAKIANKDS